MKEHPLLCNAHVARAIRNGRQTQDRRPIIPRPIHLDTNWPGGSWFWSPIKSVVNSFEDTSDWWRKFIHKEKPHAIWANGAPMDDYFLHFSLWQPGDHLWVRETWRQCVEQPGIMYRADGWENVQAEYNLKWRPSIHMPRWASRTTVKVLKIRVERVQDISDSDIEAEGTPQNIMCYDDYRDKNDPVLRREQFRIFWNSIYSKRGLGWDHNPWVWVTEFKVIESR